MAKVSAPVVLDSAVWERIDAAGKQAGLTRDQLIDEAVGRLLGGQALAALFTRVRERSNLTEDEAATLVASERAQMREGR